MDAENTGEQWVPITFFLEVVTHSFISEVLKLTSATSHVISWSPWAASCGIGCVFPHLSQEESIATHFRDSFQYFFGILLICLHAG